MATSTRANIEVSELYVALFGRAPDAEGLAFWAGLRDAGQSTAQIADAMFVTSPARTYFPSGQTHEGIISSFYVNVLGRQADADGLAFWTAKLDFAGATPGTVIAEMIGVVATYPGTDPAGQISAALFNNRSAAAQFYGEHNGSLARATSVLSGVTDEPGTVTDARTLVLASGAMGTIDAGGFAEISIGAVSADLSLTHVAADTALTVRESMFTYGLGPPLVTSDFEADGTSDSITIDLASESFIAAGFFSLLEIEHVTIENFRAAPSSDGNAIYVDGWFQSITVVGNTAVEFGIANGTLVDIMDASAMSAAVYIRARSATGVHGELRGGSGNDALIAMNGGYSFSGGAGNDSIVGAGNLDIATGGTGADTFVPGASLSRAAYMTIMDFTPGGGDAAGDTVDLYKLVGPDASGSHWVLPKATPVGGTTFTHYLDAAASATTEAAAGIAQIRWFQYASDTYVVVDRSSAATFQDGTDQFVKIMGTFDISTCVGNVADTAFG